MAKLTGGNIANVERIKIELEGEDAATSYVFETATSCTFTAAVSSGQEVEQRVKNALCGMIKTDDIVKGYDIELEDQRLIAEVMALVDGGTLETAAEGGEWTKYTAPVIGSVVERKPFTLTMYTSDRNADGDAIEYYAWEFKACRGKPVGGSSADNQFTNMKYTIQSRPAFGVSPMTVSRVDELPVVA